MSPARVPTDDEIREMVALAKSLGMKVMLKPTVNCANGVWRAHINFFDIDVPCEPKWGNWFKNYADYQLRFARLAQETGCEYLIIGCEMVQAQRKEAYWREMIAQIRGVYGGLITYNTDKYQEGEVAWWDACDLISSSGYYPIDDWDNQLDRIEKVLRKFDRPFFFAEAGCMARDTSPAVPNDWSRPGRLSLQAQADFYHVMFEKCAQRDWVGGFGLWDWPTHLYPKEKGQTHDGYHFYGKPACQVISDFYASRQ